MNQQQRREAILEMLMMEEGYISASQLAARFGITRQIIVSDVALLRANGHSIQATRRGYRMEHRPVDGRIKSIVCRHRSDQVLDEFYAVVDNGGSIIGLEIEHPIYGQISADLNIDSRFDAQEFVQRQKSTNASQLSDLTGGIHVHTLRVPDEAAYDRILRALKNLKILADEAAED